MDPIVLRPSASYRWLNCPGAEQRQPAEEESSVYAQEGSAAHFLAAVCLKKKKTPEDYSGRVIRPVGDDFTMLRRGAKRENGDYLVDDMVPHISQYTAAIRADMEALPGSVLTVETKAEAVHGLAGTRDASLVQPFGVGVVYDLKYGAGVPVEVKENPQLMIYALGLLATEDVDPIEIVVVQPRARHKDGPVRRWLVSQYELLAWRDEVLLPRMAAAQVEGADVCAGDWCSKTFCRAQATCPAMHAHAMEICKTKFDGIPLPPPGDLSQDDMVKVLKSSEMLQGWLRAVEAYATNLMQHGGSVPGFKLVHKRTLRAWSDQRAVMERLSRYKDFIWKKELLSPAQMEKLIKSKGWEVEVADLIDTPVGALTIAPESDKRPAAGPALDAVPEIEDLLE